MAIPNANNTTYFNGTIAFGGNQSLNFDCTNVSTLRVDLEGTFNGGIQFLASTDGLFFQPIFGIDDYLLDGQLYQTNISSARTPSGTWKFDVGGFQTFQVIAQGLGSLGT